MRRDICFAADRTTLSGRALGAQSAHARTTKARLTGSVMIVYDRGHLNSGGMSSSGAMLSTASCTAWQEANPRRLDLPRNAAKGVLAALASDPGRRT